MCQLAPRPFLQILDFSALCESPASKGHSWTPNRYTQDTQYILQCESLPSPEFGAANNLGSQSAPHPIVFDTWPRNLAKQSFSPMAPIIPYDCKLQKIEHYPW